MGRIWGTIENQWKVPEEFGSYTFDGLKEKAESFLRHLEINPCHFSHFAIVVKDIAQAVSELLRLGFEDARAGGFVKNWVGSFEVYVVRGELEGKELEFIEPHGENFFSKYLLERGERLQHIGFVVKQIEADMEKLKSAGVTLLNDEPFVGSHGKITFAEPLPLRPLLIEMCQVAE